MEWGGILFDARQEALLRLIVVKVMDYLGKLLPRQKETDGWQTTLRQKGITSIIRKYPIMGKSN